MKNLTNILLLFVIAACGVEPQILYSDQCIIDVWHTQFEYTVKKHPNGDAEILCRVGNTEQREYYAADHYNIESLDCSVGSDWLERWHFHYSGYYALVDWLGATQPLDEQSGQAIPHYLTFQNCEPELL